MAATMRRSPRAVAMSVYVVRAFEQMKEALLANATIAIFPSLFPKLPYSPLRHFQPVAYSGLSAIALAIRRALIRSSKVSPDCARSSICACARAPSSTSRRSAFSRTAQRSSAS